MSRSQVSIFGIVAFLIVFAVLFVYVFAPFAMVASDVSVGHAGVDGVVGFVVAYWSWLIFLLFIIAFAWKMYAG